jgi:CRISPR/Cas system CMR-associated protein Cmr5 small subunit
LEQSLINSFKSLLYTIPGSKERDQISYLLNRSVQFHLGDELTEAISNTIKHSPHTIEHNLDFLSVPFPATWVEWNESPRYYNGHIVENDKSYPEKVGALIATHPEDDNGVIAVIAWRDSKNNVDHSQAILSWNNYAFQKMSNDARKYFGKGKDETFARIMSLVQTSVPNGFKEEMEILYDVKETDKSLDEFHLDALKNSSGETMFLLTFLLMLQTNQTKITQSPESLDENVVYNCHLDNNQKQKIFIKPKGFFRNKKLKGTTLEWFPL